MSQMVARCCTMRAMTVVAVFMMPGIARAGTTVFVDPAAAPGGQGASWDTAYRSLQDALAFVRETEDVTAVHVAQGTYAPDQGESVITGDRRASFRPISGVTIRGGFAGVGAADPDERDVMKFPSVLTGDLAGDDGPNFGGNEENSYHVVAVTNAHDDAVLDGFVVRGGNADGPAPDERGGGILIEGGEPMFVDLVVEGNAAFFGGGLFVDRGAPTLDAIVFDANWATFGGAIYADRSPLVATATDILGGAALSGGGAYLTGGAPVFDGCSFFENDADLDGGGVYASGTTAEFRQCEFRIDTALFDGGAMYIVAGAPHLESCTFITNFADEGGGLRQVGGTGEIDDCTFSLNFARRGGAMNASLGAAVVRDCRFDRNESEAGGGVLVEDGAPSFVECTFDRNEAIQGGGFHGTGGTPTIDSCTFTANEGGQRGGGIFMANGAASVRDCVLSENTAVGFFVSNGGGIDLLDATGTTISRCVFVSNRANFGAGLGIRGDATIADCEFLEHAGFVGGGLYATEGAPLIERCTFRGNSAEGSVVAAGGAIHASIADPVVNDCRFESNTSDTAGGAMYVDLGDPTLNGCVFDGNTSVDDGAGLFVGRGDPTVRRCAFRNNESAGLGGGIAAEDSSGTYVDCRFVGNRGRFGGGVVSLSGEPLFVNCVFDGNRATGTAGESGCTGIGLGGGLSSVGGAAHVVNSTFAANAAECGGSGGGVSIFVGSLVNCVLWGNTDGGGDDESAQVSGAAVSIDYCCVQGLTGDLGGTGNIGEDPRFVDPIGPDGTAGTADDDLRLAPGSPAIDAGENASVPVGIETDADDRPRFVDDPFTKDTGSGAPPLVDLGATEVQIEACAADIDGDGAVGMGDLLVILAGWGACPPKGECPGDVNGNGARDFADVLAVIGAWGACP